MTVVAQPRDHHQLRSGRRRRAVRQRRIVRDLDLFGPQHAAHRALGAAVHEYQTEATVVAEREAERLADRGLRAPTELVQTRTVLANFCSVGMLLSSS